MSFFAVAENKFRNCEKKVIYNGDFLWFLM